MVNKLTARAIGLTFTGAIIGAGFASGQEIKQFFVNYGAYAFGGALVSIVAFTGFCYFLSLLCQQRQIADLEQLLICLGGSRSGRYFWHLLNLFMWFGLTVMLAGSATLLFDLCSLHRLLGAALAAALVYSVCRRQVAGLAAANELLLPLLCFLILFLLLRSTGVPGTAGIIGAVQERGWFWSALLYMGSNSAILLAILPALVAEAEDARAVRQGVLLAASLLLCLLLINIWLLQRYGAVYGASDMPLLQVAKYLIPSLPWLYGVLLFIALITTAFANALSLNKYALMVVPKHANLAFISVLVAAVLVAQRGFGQLVATLYPLTGYICLSFYIFSTLRWVIGFDRG